MPEFVNSSRVPQEQSSHPHLRKDAQRSRERLLDAAGELLRETGKGFGLPDLARRSGVAIATVYRHYSDVAGVIDDYQSRLITMLTRALSTLPDEGAALVRLQKFCFVWVDQAEQWGPAATRVRPSSGVVERVRRGNKRTKELFDTLVPVVEALIAESQIPVQPVEYAITMWFTLFDERLIMEMRDTFGWDKDLVTEQLTGSLLAVLRAPESSQRAIR